MVALEAAILTVLVILLIYTSWTDCRGDIISNCALILATVIILPLDVIYYSLYGGMWLGIAGINFLALALAGIFFYAQHIWGAGDSKLLFVIGLAIPGRFYADGRLDLGSGLVIVAVAFIAALFWATGYGLFQGIKQHDLLRIPQQYYDVKRLLASYILVVTLIQMLDFVCRMLLPNVLIMSPYLIRGIYFMVLLALISWRNSLPIKRLYALSAGNLALSIALFAVGLLQLQFGFSIFVLVAVVGLFFIRLIIEKYNYRTIPTCEVKAGQILSAATVFSFGPSRIKGLPLGVSEDMEAKITEEEAASVRRWAKSKYGRANIVIVRKIPFAVFLTLGTVALLVLEGWNL